MEKRKERPHAARDVSKLTLQGDHVDVAGRGDGRRAAVAESRRRRGRRRGPATAGGLKKGCHIFWRCLRGRGGKDRGGGGRRGRGLGWWGWRGGLGRTGARPARHEAGLEQGFKAGDEGAQVVVHGGGRRGDGV